MSTYLTLIFTLMVFGLISCGSSKSGYDSGPVPDVGRRQGPVPDPDTLILKNEVLKLTHITQTWKANSFRLDEGLEKYSHIQKSFLFPIQFNGWVSLDNIEHSYGKCFQSVKSEAEFILEDDHNGVVILSPGEKVQTSKEKLYTLRVEFTNDATCRKIDLDFGILYGTNE